MKNFTFTKIFNEMHLVICRKKYYIFMQHQIIFPFPLKLILSKPIMENAYFYIINAQKEVGIDFKKSFIILPKN